MSVVSFTNPGLVPIEAITTMGVNVKESENPIGFFGTGLKYAIAGILRTRQKITIYRGLERLQFETRPIEVRGKSFDFIFMNGRQLGFTTELGKTWETWQLFRELYSNCLDEAGTMYLYETGIKEGWTTIIVRGEAFFTAALQKNEVFLSTPIRLTNEKCEIHEGQNQSIFYRGIKVGKLDKPTVFTYNILAPMQLTEDRTLKYGFLIPEQVGKVIVESHDESIIERAITCRGWYEFDMTYPYDMNQFFAETVLKVAAQRGFIAVAPIALKRAEEFMNTKAELKPAILTDWERRQIDRSVVFLRKIGFDVHQKILVVNSLGEGIAGQARSGQIYLAKATIDKGGNWLIGTILEEHLHLERGFVDESRDFQNFLLDLAIKFSKQALGMEDV